MFITGATSKGEEEILETKTKKSFRKRTFEFDLFDDISRFDVFLVIGDPDVIRIVRCHFPASTFD